MPAQASTLPGVKPAGYYQIGDRVQLVRGPHPRWTGKVIDLVGGEFPYRVLWDDGNGYETCCALELRDLGTCHVCNMPPNVGCFRPAANGPVPCPTHAGRVAVTA